MKAQSIRRHLPWHLRPVEDRANPSGHRHLKLPSVLLQVPKAQISGSSTHSSISKGLHVSESERQGDPVIHQIDNVQVQC